MILTKTHFLLFSSFPREVGLKRKIVYNLKEWLKEIERMNGFEDVYTSLYEVKHFTVDKIFFDIDSKDLDFAFRVASKLYRWLVDHEYTVIPVFSGAKGFHLYVLLEPRAYEDVCVEKKKRLLANASFYILEKAGVLDRPEIDRHVIGDIRRIVRVPNTLNLKTNSFAIFLPPEWPDRLEPKNIVEMAKHVGTDYNYIIRNLPTLYDFPQIIRQEDYKEMYHKIEKERRLKIPENLKEFLKRLLRPCLFYEITKPEPRHEARVATTIDLLHMGFSVDEIVEIYSKLGWVDFDEGITRYQVEHIKAHNYKPYSCYKLRKLFGSEYCIKYCW